MEASIKATAQWTALSVNVVIEGAVASLEPGGLSKLSVLVVLGATSNKSAC